jgi:hypothetical protein
VVFEIWDATSGNLLGSWTTEREALDLVRHVYETDGELAVEELVLAQETAEGKTVTLGQGMELLNRGGRGG